MSALERPLIELIAEVVPADRGAVILSGDQRTGNRIRRWAAIVGPAARGRLHVSRPVIDRVLHDAVGVMATGPAPASSVLAAPLVAFDTAPGSDLPGVGFARTSRSTRGDCGS